MPKYYMLRYMRCQHSTCSDTCNCKVIHAQIHSMAKYYMLIYIHVLSQSTTCSGKHGGKVLYAQENMVAKYYMLRKTRW